MGRRRNRKTRSTCHRDETSSSDEFTKTNELINSLSKKFTNTKSKNKENCEGRRYSPRLKQNLRQDSGSDLYDGDDEQTPFSAISSCTDDSDLETLSYHSKSTRTGSKKRKSVTFSGCKMVTRSTFSHSTSVTSNSSVDSGICISPPAPKMRKTLPKETSTPFPDDRAFPSPKIDDCFGFDSLLSPEPNVSPVKNVTFMDLDDVSCTPGNMMASPQLKDVQISNLSVLYNVPIIPTKKRKRSSHTKKIDTWTSKMNADFSEIELHVLNIESA